jgi:hypothetical protein
MKKINCIIVSSENEKIITELSKNIKEKIILLNKNIFNLEKIKNNNKIIIYPINFEEKNYEKEKSIFLEITTKHLKEINKIIIDTKEPKYAKTFQNINNEDFINALKNDLEQVVNLLKMFFNQKSKVKVIILIHKEKTEKNDFLTIKSCINKFLIELMNNVNKNNININCVSTENIKLNYKKNIYPFKKNTNLKKISYLTKVLKFIFEKNIKNKIIIA